MPKGKLFGLLKALMLLLFIAMSCDARIRRLRKIKKLSSKAFTCDMIYSAGLEYNNDPTVPKYTPESFPSDRPALFTTIYLDEQSGMFDFNYMDKKAKEYKDAQALTKFFIDKSFPPKMNWFQLKECCLSKGKFQDKDIFKEVCFSMIYGFISYRYFLMVKYVEKAFVEGIRNQDYIMGEVPLTEEQKIERSKNKRKKNFSKQYYHNKNPVYLTKGGKKIRVDEDTFEFAAKQYREAQSKYISILKDKLSKACSISFIIPNACQNYVRVCPFLFDSDYTKYIPNAREAEVAKNPNAFINQPANKDYFYSYNCLKDGYFITCSSIDFFNLKITGEVKGDKPKPDPKDIGIVPESFRINSIKIYYFGSVTATSDLDFTVVTLESSVIKNYHMQRMIVDNYNNRFQNDMMAIAIQQQIEVVNVCRTTGDCLDTNAYETGFIESKFKKGEVTGIEEIDDIFRNEKSDHVSKFSDASFVASSALGMMALVEFWDKMREEMLDIALADVDKFDVDFSQGILANVKRFNSASVFIEQMTQDYLNTLPDKLTVQDIQDIGKIVVQSMKDFETSVEKGLKKISDISNGIRTDLEIFPSTSRYERSVKLNQAYTLLTLDAMQEITQIPPILDLAVKSYQNFIYKKGTALMYANEAYFNLGGIKYQVKGKSIIFCNSALEAGYMIMGYDLLHFYLLYPEQNNTDPSYNYFNHGDGLLKLAKYFDRIMDLLLSECKLFQSEKSSTLFLDDLVFTGYEKIKLDITDEVGNQFFIPPIKVPEGQKPMDEYPVIKHLRILEFFASKAMILKKKYGLDPLVLYGKVINLEKNVLTQIANYIVYNKRESIGPIAKIAEYILTSMTFSFSIAQKSFDFLRNKKIVKGQTDFLNKNGIRVKSNDASTQTNKKKISYANLENRTQIISNRIQSLKNMKKKSESKLDKRRVKVIKKNKRKIQK